MDMKLFDLQLFAEAEGEVPGENAEAASASSEETDVPETEDAAPEADKESMQDDGAARGEELIRGEVMKVCGAILDECVEAKNFYPSFDVAKESANPRFKAALAAGFSAKEAYEAIHFEELVAGAMQFAADRVYEAAQKGLSAAKDRPVENGAGGGDPHRPGRDVASMSESEIRDVLRRVAKGEVIRF